VAIADLIFIATIIFGCMLSGIDYFERAKSNGKIKKKKKDI